MKHCANFDNSGKCDIHFFRKGSILTSFLTCMWDRIQRLWLLNLVKFDSYVYEKNGEIKKKVKTADVLLTESSQ